MALPGKHGNTIKDLPLDKPAKLQVLVDRAQFRKIKAIAALMGVTIPDLVREFISKFVESEGQKGE